MTLVVPTIIWIFLWFLYFTFRGHMIHVKQLNMARHTKIGLVVAFVFLIITTPIGLLSWNNPTLSSIGQLLTLPALPVVYALVQFFPPPMGESEISPWDYFMLSVGILVSALIWGLVAGFLSRYFRAKPNDAA